MTTTASNPLPRHELSTEWTGADDLGLVDGLVRRDERAWREFDRRFRSKITKRVKTIVRGSATGRRDVPDIVSEIMCALLAEDCAKLRCFDPTRASLEAWILVIARSNALSYLRAAQRRPEELTIDDAEDSERGDGQIGARWIADGGEAFGFSYPLAVDGNGDAVAVPADAIAWRVRRSNAGGRARPMFNSETGRVLEVPLTSTLDDLRDWGCSPGRYRLDAVDSDGSVIAGVTASCEISGDQ